jgi:hypothetical protein
MKPHRAEKKSPPPAGRQHGGYLPDQARRRDQGQGRHEREEDEPVDAIVPKVSHRPNTLRDPECDVQFLVVWLLGVPSLVVVTWSLVAG